MPIVRFLLAGIGFWFGIVLSAASYPIDDLSLYEKVYLQGMVTNSPVLIIDIDRSGNRVKVQEDDGFSRWVGADRIMSKWETRTDALKKVGGIGLIAYCVYKVPDCDSARLGNMLYNNDYIPGAPLPKVGGGYVPFAVSSADPERADHSQSGGVPDFMNPDTFERIPNASDNTVASSNAVAEVQHGTAGAPNTVEAATEAGVIRYHLENACDEAVEIEYALKTPSFERAPPFVIALAAGERSVVKLGSYSEFDRASILYILARSPSHQWSGNGPVTIDGKTRHFLQPTYVSFEDQNRLVRLTCE